MSQYDELVSKLREIFQIDRPELDFGVYRILNARADEINAYLSTRLKDRAAEAFASGAAANSQARQRELDETINNLKAADVDPDTSPKVQALRTAIAAASSGASEHENAVFSHLLAFFRRYYDKGDFISQRRYKGDTYAIPYAGEEVVLHWANKDQYYTKSGEAFCNYAFKLDDGRTVHFRLMSADTAKDNRKDNDKERRFALAEPRSVTRLDDGGEACEDEIVPVSEEGDDLIVRFEYRVFPAKTKQDILVDQAVEAVLAEEAVRERWLDLTRRAPTEKKPQRTLLEKHLTTYTQKNTADYFIHKDLGGFLRRELDFYIKNEVMNLDDVQDAASFAAIETNLRMIQCLRAIALDLITFLASIEDFQKKLWLKKKFVVSSHYCVTLDRLPEALYPAIAANEAQWAQWHDLGMRGSAKPGTADDLKADPYLMVDTALFDEAFRADLLKAISDVDASTDGLLVNGDNFQALTLLKSRYNECIKCTYIDPPYNTGKGDFLYKDGYEASSWYSMMLDRVEAAKFLLKSDGIFALQIGDQEAARSRLLVETLFADRKNSAVVRRGIKNVQAQFDDIDRLSLGHDLIHICTKNAGVRLPHLRHRLKAEKPGKWDTFWRGTDRATMRYELFGHTPETGQWRWEEGRATQSAENYREYLEEQSSLKSLDNWWAESLQAGIDLDFVRLNNEGVVQYYVPPQDFRLVSDNWLDIPASGSFTDFPHEKSLSLLNRILGWNTESDDLVLDFFAGSGSISHAAIESTRLGKRLRHIAIDMSDYFADELFPRICRAVYSSTWKDGCPEQPETGLSQSLKVLKIESYEDTLNNLALARDESQKGLLDGLNREARDDYLMRYMLDVEARGSLLSVEDFRKPFDYELNIAVDSAGAHERRRVDLVETFNYLIGLTVKTVDIQLRQGFTAVEGTLPTGERTLVLWRDCETIGYEELNKLCDELAITPADSDYDVVYINGDHNIPSVVQSSEEEGGIEKRLKLRQIEPAFLQAMFDVSDA